MQTGRQLPGLLHCGHSLRIEIRQLLQRLQLRHPRKLFALYVAYPGCPRRPCSSWGSFYCRICEMPASVGRSATVPYISRRVKRWLSRMQTPGRRAMASAPRRELSATTSTCSYAPFSRNSETQTQNLRLRLRLRVTSRSFSGDPRRPREGDLPPGSCGLWPVSQIHQT
jgi:hypothetical protein